MVFIDTHSHISDESYSGDEAATVQRALNASVLLMLQADIDSKERPGMLSAVDRHPDCMQPMAGLYPGSVDDKWQQEIDAVEKALASRDDFAAIGEIGLDYHFSTEFAKEQQEAFRVQLEMAAKLNMPVNIHLRDATEDFFRIMEDTKHLGIRGNLHAFSGSAETFQRLQKYGDWYVGIGGVLTFKKASIAEDLKKIPMDRIFLETDAPYLAPTPLRGTRNESANIPIIAAKVAEIKGITCEEVAEITTKNAIELFRIKAEIACHLK